MKEYIVVFFLFLSSFGYAQISPPTIDLYAVASGGPGENKPFWNISNQLGRYTLAPFAGLAGMAIESTDSSASYMHVDYGVDAFTRFKGMDLFVIPEAYVNLRIPFLELWAGRKEEIIGNQDSLLSLGSTVWSRNALPMPKVVLATPGYVDVPFTRGYVEVNGSIGHGWFEQDRYVENLYLHQKHIHMRFGGDYFINASLGMIHFAQWGGTSPDPDYGDLPSDMDAFFRVFFGLNGDSTTVNVNEAINRLGNHLGSLNYRIDLKAKQYTFALYYQTLFEDNSGLSSPFYRDGILGFSVAAKDPGRVVNRVLFEYLHTTFQSGATHVLNDSIVQYGKDNYFNHFIYQNGWTYHGMTLGTPLITSPLFNDDGSYSILNNRVMAFHLGLQGVLGKINYRSLFTYSINKGTYSNPIDPSRQQFSWYVETLFPSVWQGIDMQVMLAADIGQMYGNNLGVHLLFRKTFSPFLE